MPSRPRYHRLVLVSAAALAAASSLLLSELAVRAALPEWAPRTARVTAFWRHDDRLGWAHVPGSSGRFSSVGFDVAVRINAAGFRGRDIPYARSGDSKRIVVLGDSHVWGFGVEEDETFCRVIERTRPNLEVVNLGVSGYSTDQELLLYEDQAYRYDADAIVLLVAHNDLRGNTRTIESSVYGKPRFRLAGDQLELHNMPVAAPSWLKRTLFDLSARSYLLTRALRVIDDSRRAADVAIRPRQPRPAPAAKDDRAFPRTPSHRITMRLIRELQRAIERRQPSARFLVVFADWRDDLGQEATDYLRQFDIAALSLHTVIDPNDPEWHLSDGLHWTPAGHARAAEVIGQRLDALLLDAAPEGGEASGGRQLRVVMEGLTRHAG